MLIINPYIFKQIPGITFGFSTKVGLRRNQPYYFNMSYTVGDDIKIVSENREKCFNQLGLNSESVAYQEQVHGDGVSIITEGGDCGESDAMITDTKNLGLAISSADCCVIFIYDPVNRIIAGVHSGWRGTKVQILLNVLQKLSNEFHSSPGDMICYLSPSISQQNYKVGPEVAGLFDIDYLLEKNGIFYLNIPQINYDISCVHAS